MFLSKGVVAVTTKQKKKQGKNPRESTFHSVLFAYIKLRAIMGLDEIA